MTEYISVQTAAGTKKIAMQDIGDGVLAQFSVPYVDEAIASLVNPISTVEHRSNTSTVTAVTVSTTETTLLTASDSRHIASFYNNGTTDLYIRLGSGALTTLFTVKVPADGYYVLDSPGVWTGIVTAIRASGSAAVMVTSLTSVM